MELNINILDSFPSINKIQQKNNLFIEFNSKEYSLNKLITQQEAMVSKKVLSKYNFKIYFINNQRKILIGANNINQSSIKFDNNNKCFITWLEFRKIIQNNNKELNDINFLFFDCIRLKFKISLIKTFPKTDKRIKKTKNKVKIGARTPIIPKKEETKFFNKNDNIEINNEDNDNLDSYRNIEANYLLKSKSQEENVKVKTDELTNIKVNTNNIIERYNNLRIKSEESISREMKNLLQFENDCLLTDNNLLENYSYSTSLGDNNNKNLLKNKVENENKIINDNIKKENIKYDFVPKKYLLSLNNYKSLNNQEKIKEEMNTSINDDKNKTEKISIMKSKFNSINKLIKTTNKKHEKKFKKIKTNNMNKSNSIKTHSLIKDKIYFNTNTYNNFYKKCQINEENNHLETNVNNENKNGLMNKILIPYNTESKKNDIINEERITFHNNDIEFISMKKDYELLYTTNFIKDIKNDLLDLEFNIALEKSISLFLTYNSHISLFYKEKNDLLETIKNYVNKIELLNKKMNLLNISKRKDENKENNKKILNDYSNINLKINYLKQKNIFQKLVNDKIDKKLMLKSIISILLKKKNNIFSDIKSNKKLEKENINTNNNKAINNKSAIKSPSRSSNKLKIKSPQVVKKKQKFEFMSEIKNKNSIFTNKLINKKKSLNKNLTKNKSINYIISLENEYEKNNEIINYKESKASQKNNIINYSSAKNKFFNSKIEKGK